MGNYPFSPPLCLKRGQPEISNAFRPRLGEGNGMEWKGMKRIILEYSSLPLFGSFNGGNGKLISLFGSLSREEWVFLSMEGMENSFLCLGV